MKNGFYTFILIFTLHKLAFGQSPARYTISGYVREQGSGEQLIGVNVYAPAFNRGNQTNTLGFYSLTFPASDSLLLLFTIIGYKTEKRIVQFSGDTELNIFLTPDTATTEEVKIITEEYKKASDGADISTIEIPMKQIKDIPALMGEKDVLKVLQLMPGVKKAGEGTSGLYVRGGGPDQNLILLDDATIYNPYHLFGFFSIFNGDAIRSVELIKGGFPARYGGRLSSVVEMNMKEGNTEKIHGEAGMGLISSRLTVEGPIQKGKSSFLVSGRRTYIDLLTYPFLSSKNKAGYNFHDLNVKLSHDFGRKNKIYLSAYYGRDKFYQDSKVSDDNYDKIAMGWSNIMAAFRWNHLFSDKLFVNTSLIYSNYQLKINEEDFGYGLNYKLKYHSGIRDFSLKHDLHYTPGNQHSFRMGILAIYHTFSPGAMVARDTYSGDSTKTNLKINTLESSLYLEDIYKPFPKLTINAGLRFSDLYTDEKNYFNTEPRLSVGYKLKEDLALKAGYTIMNQYMHLLSNSSIGLPTDLWVPATPRIRPQNSHQVAAGIVKDFPKNTALTIEGYYKKTTHIIGYKEGASFFFADPMNVNKYSWEQRVTSGQGWSYGAEFLLHKKTGKFSGWIGYTLSWTQLQFDSVNNGKKFYARYDRRHDVSLVGIYKLNEKITISGTWVYGTGNAITMPLAQYPAPVHSFSYSYLFGGPGYPVWSSANGPRNGTRIPPYHRLDLSIQFNKNLKWGGKRTWEISIYNVYNRKNPFFYFVQQEGTLGKSVKYTLKKVSLFPVIPSISYQLKF